METTETTPIAQAGEGTTPAPERPDLLKILCILSFSWTGLVLLLFGALMLFLGISDETAVEMWSKVRENNPNIPDVDPVEFFHAIGMFALYCFLLNVFSLLGAIMMWRLEKIGFYIYVIAEIAIYFVPFGVDMGEQSRSYGGTILSALVDLVFIIMYAVNLKYMNKRRVQV